MGPNARLDAERQGAVLHSHPPEASRSQIPNGFPGPGRSSAVGSHGEVPDAHLDPRPRRRGRRRPPPSARRWRPGCHEPRPPRPAPTRLARRCPPPPGRCLIVRSAPPLRATRGLRAPPPLPRRTTASRLPRPPRPSCPPVASARAPTWSAPRGPPHRTPCPDPRRPLSRAPAVHGAGRPPLAGASGRIHARRGRPAIGARSAWPPAVAPLSSVGARPGRASRPPGVASARSPPPPPPLPRRAPAAAAELTARTGGVAITGPTAR